MQCDECLRLHAEVQRLQRKMHQWERIVSAALAWNAVPMVDRPRALDLLTVAIAAYRADKLPEPTDVERLNGVLKAVVEMVVNNKPLWKIQSAAVDALGEATRQSHSTCCLSCQQRKDCAVCHCHVAKPDEEQQTEKRKCVAGCMDRHFCNAPKLHEGGCHCKLDE